MLHLHKALGHSLQIERRTSGRGWGACQRMRRRFMLSSVLRADYLIS